MFVYEWLFVCTCTVNCISVYECPQLYGDGWESMHHLLSWPCICLTLSRSFSSPSLLPLLLLFLSKVPFIHQRLFHPSSLPSLSVSVRGCVFVCVFVCICTYGGAVCNNHQVSPRKSTVLLGLSRPPPMGGPHVL